VRRDLLSGHDPPVTSAERRAADGSDRSHCSHPRRPGAVRPPGLTGGVRTPATATAGSGARKATMGGNARPV